MSRNGILFRAASLIAVLALLLSLGAGGPAVAQEEGPVMLDPTLEVQTVVEGLVTPTTLAFLDDDEMFVLQKNTGEVLHIMEGTVHGPVLDLAVNFGSERGLLGIAIDPGFNENGYVYLYWTCSAPPPTGTTAYPSAIECADEPQTGADTDDVLAVPLLGNRVDRFHWDGTSLTWDLNLIKLRAYQVDGAPLPRAQGDEEQPPRGNHDGGVISFGEDGKLYILIGDVGRRGWMQNLPFGPIQYPAEPHNGEDLSDLLDEPRITPEMVGEFEDHQGVLITEEDRISAGTRFRKAWHIP